MAVRSGITVSFTAISSRYKGIRLAPMNKELKAHARDTADDLIKVLKIYPKKGGGAYRQKKQRRGYKQLRGSGMIGGEYVRTDDLKNAWKKKDRSGGGRIAYEIQNHVRDRRHRRYYARLVHGGPDGSGQWWFHAQTGWLRVDEAVHNIGGRKVFAEIAQDIITDHST